MFVVLGWLSKIYACLSICVSTKIRSPATETTISDSQTAAAAAYARLLEIANPFIFL